MFRDDNDEFMKSFQALEEAPKGLLLTPPQMPVVNEAASRKLRRYCENASFNMVSEQSDQKSFNSKENEAQEATPVIEVFAPQPKRRNWIKETMSSSRKFSDASIAASIKKPQDQESSDFNLPDFGKESEAVSCENIEYISGNQEFEAPERKQYEPPEEDPETYFMKKVRVLETKFKQLALLYDNTTMKLKKQNKKLTNQLEVYREHVQKYYPTLEAQISKALEEKEENRSFASSSSSSSRKNQDVALPVVSQIIEVKIQGKKLCDMIRELNIKVKAYEKMAEEESSKNQKTAKNDSFLQPSTCCPFTRSPSKNSPITPSRAQLNRKFSIPAVYSRYKRPSFQTTIISELEKTERFNMEKQTLICTQLLKDSNNE